MNILILGGNRFFGKKLLYQLSIKKNLKIYILNRGNKKINKEIINMKNIFFIKCDRKNKFELSNKLKDINVDIIFDNCAYVRDDVKNIINIFKNKKIIYFFSSTVMSYLNLYLTKELKENDWYDANSTKHMNKLYEKYEITYAKNKRQIENYLIYNSNIKYIILRIHNVIGKKDFSKKTIKFILSNKTIMDVNSIKNNDFFQFTYDIDLIEIIKKLIVNPPKSSSIFNICNDKIEASKFYMIRDKYISNKRIAKGDDHFPFPKNVLMKNNKIKRKLNFKFSSFEKIIKNFSLSNEFK